MRFHPPGFLVFGFFLAALALASVPHFGTIAIIGCIVVEGYLLLGIAGWGRDGEHTTGR